MDVCVIGSGYVGLVAGTCFAESGNDVVCVDVDEAKIKMLNDGIPPIYEPGLEELVKRNMEEKRLSFTTELEPAVKKSSIIFIAVGTPPDEDGSADLKYVLEVAKSIGRALNGPKIIVIKSTVPVGTAEKVKEAVKRETDQEFSIVSNPEFLKEGAAIDDFMKPDRVVVGTDSPSAEEIMKDLYAPFVRTENPILIMDSRSAEMTKYASNAMLATRISFMNEIARICQKVGANVDNVRRGMGFDKRIGFKFLFPGVGYGGSCFPKDVKALLKTAQLAGEEAMVLNAVEAVNARQKKYLAELLKKHFNNKLEGKTIAVWGLSFKPQTDDMREAPSLVFIEEMLESGAKIVAYDPEAMNEAKKILGDKITYAETPYDALKNADSLVIITEWNEFRRPNFQKIKDLLASPIIFDGRNIYNPVKMKEIGFTYYSIGR